VRLKKKFKKVFRVKKDEKRTKKRSETHILREKRNLELQMEVG